MQKGETMSGDQMTFPSTWEEFEKIYGFTDTEEIYTNGSRLIQSFRVEQWLEHLQTEPIRHGKWIFNPKDGIEMMFTLPKCSECGAESADSGNYCPNCGARMDK